MVSLLLLLLLLLLLFLESFSHQCFLVIFLWRLSDSKTAKVSRTLLSILANLNKSVVKMFHNFFFNTLARSRYLSFFSLSFSFALWWARTQTSTILQVLFLFLFFIIIRSGRLAAYYFYHMTPWEFFTSEADSLSLKLGWQQVSSSFQDSSHYSGRSKLCCSLDGLYSSSYFQILLSFY